MGYSDVTAAMQAGTPHEVICGTCPWDRLCIQPPQMTREEIDRQVKSASADAQLASPAGSAHDGAMAGLFAAMMFAGKDSSGRMCPVFALRLRADRRTADSIRSLMQSFDTADIGRG